MNHHKRSNEKHYILDPTIIVDLLVFICITCFVIEILVGILRTLHSISKLLQMGGLKKKIVHFQEAICDILWKDIPPSCKIYDFVSLYSNCKCYKMHSIKRCNIFLHPRGISLLN